jgi:hypothetical protein
MPGCYLITSFALLSLLLFVMVAMRAVVDYVVC